MSEPEPLVIVIDDDAPTRETLSSLIRSVGLRVELFGSAQEFLKSDRPDAPSCLVLDIRLPGTNGLDLQAKLAGSNIRIPIIFITGHGDIQMSVRAMKAGAVEFLTKPFRDQELLDAIYVGLEKDRVRRQQEGEIVMLRRRFESLTPREQAVLPWVVAGRLNKQIAAELGTTEGTVKIHRSQLMHKMHADSLPELVKMAQKLAIKIPEQS
jgi:FixJ family two-component response regulator